MTIAVHLGRKATIQTNKRTNQILILHIMSATSRRIGLCNWNRVSELRMRLVMLNMLKPSGIFLLTVPRRCFFCGSFFVVYVSCLALLCCLICSLQPCDNLLGKR